jgi:transposase InsO family protein
MEVLIVQCGNEEGNVVQGNSYIERFHRSLKEEEVSTAEYRSLKEARTSTAR